MKFQNKMKLGVSFFILLLIFTTSISFIDFSKKNDVLDKNALSLSAPDDPYEPNNNASTAFDLSSLENLWLSSIAEPGIQLDIDWYNITIMPGRERLIVNLLFWHFDDNLDVVVLDSALNPIVNSTTFTDNEYIDYVLPTPGLYHLVVYGSNVGTKYDLLWSSINPTAMDDIYEPNDFPTFPTDITFLNNTWLSSFNGLGIKANDDWYEINVSSGFEHLMVDLIFCHAFGDINIEILDFNGPIPGALSNGVIDNEFIDIIVPASGVYLIHIYFDNFNNTYDLRWTALPLPDDLYEENDDPSIATDLTSFEGIWLSNISGLGVQYDDDWYRINVNSGKEHLRIVLLFDHFSGDIDLQLCDDTFLPVASRTSVTHNEFMDITVSPGTYFILVYFANAGNPYDLWYNTTFMLDDPYEENDQEYETYNLSPFSAMWQYNLSQFDDDWYEIYLDPGEERLRAELIYNPADGNINLEVYDLNFMYIAGSYYSPVTPQVILEFDLFPGGLYYLRVFGENKGNMYDLWWEDLVPSGSPLDDIYEENDDYYNAKDITMSNWVWGIQFDDDWYEVHLSPEDYTLLVEISFTDYDGNIDLEVYESDGFTLMGRSDSRNNFEHIKVNRSGSGVYYIRVYGENRGNYYDLHWETFKEFGDDPYEWNNHPGEAYSLIEDEHTWLSDIRGNAHQGDEDWYVIFITPGFQQLVVNVIFNHSEGNIDISVHNVWDLYNVDPTSTGYIDGNYSVDDNEYFNYYLDPGRYLIQIHGESKGNEYDLWWDDLRTDFRSDDNYEDNDLASTAYDLSNHIGHRDDYSIGGVPLQYINEIGIQSDNDWYRINVEPEFLQLRVRILYEYSAGALGIDIYDWDLSEITGNFTYTDNLYIDYVLPSNGTYYIKIYGINSGSPYDLRWETLKISVDNIPGYDILILIGAIVGISTIIIKKKRSKIQKK